MTLRNTVRNKWKWGLLGLGAAAIIGLSSTALYSSVYAQAETTDETPVAGTLRHERIFAFGEDHNALLAEALGISVEELEAAQTEVRNAAIDQAVEDGRITQVQADQLKAGEIGELHRGWQRGLMGRGLMGFSWLDAGPLDANGDHEEALAAALGITVEELQAAKAEVPAMLLAEAVAAGEITQEEADLITARMALDEYMQELDQSAYEQTIAEAVAAGVITQEQADQILSEGDRGFFGRGRFGLGGFGQGNFGPGGFGPGMDGGHRGGRFGGPQGGPGEGWFGWPGRDQTPESESPESSSAPSLEIPAIDL